MASTSNARFEESTQKDRNLDAVATVLSEIVHLGSNTADIQLAKSISKSTKPKLNYAKIIRGTQSQARRSIIFEANSASEKIVAKGVKTANRLNPRIILKKKEDGKVNNRKVVQSRLIVSPISSLQKSSQQQ